MKAHKVLLFVLICIALLAVLGFVFPKKGLKVAGVELRFLYPMELLRRDTVEVQNLDTILKRSSAADRLKQLKTMSDSFEVYSTFAMQSPSRIHYPENNLKFFDAFFEQLENSKKEKRTVHILHYGDSQIETDRITSVLRQEFQRMFGGEGPGLIPAIQTIPSATISQSFSGALSQYAVYGMNMGRVSHRRYGPMCQMAQLNGNAVISLRKGWAAPQRASHFSKVSLLLGHNGQGFNAELFNGEVSVGKKTIDDSVSRMSVLQWEIKGNMNNGKIVLNGTAEIYGIALDGHYGVAMDNIPMRGSTGEIFTGINASNLSQGYENMNVALIIMQFGGNAMPGISSASKAEWYGGVMGKQIAYLKKIYPRAQILFVPSDMSRKIDGNMQTWPYLVEVRNALKKAALENGAAFWDMFETMGGVNSMPLWVSASPQLAAPDYIHFTPRGAKQISELLLNAFLNDYQFFVLRRKAAKMSKKNGIKL